jgi:hypothetical protein
VLLLRHPCGVIASRRRGVALGKMSPIPSKEIEELTASRSPLAIRTLASVDQGNAWEMEAFRWTLLNSKAIAELREVPGFTVVRYEDLCSDPPGVTQQVFKAIDLPWHGQVGQFIRQSQSFTSRRFYGLHRAPNKVDLWRDSLPLSLQERLMEIVRDTEAGDYYAKQ